MTTQQVPLGLGALTGVVGLLAMIRLISGVFHRRVVHVCLDLPAASHDSVDRVCLLARPTRPPLDAGRARRPRPGCCRAVTVWLSTIGAVVALTCSLAGFVVIWVHDWPPRRPRGDDEFVQIQELVSDE